MAPLNTDLLKKLSRRWVGQIGSGGVTDAVVATIPFSSSTNLATDTAVVFTIDRVNANGVATPTLEETVIGVISGNNSVNSIRGAEGTAQAHFAGAVVEILVTAKGYNDIIDAILVEHSQLGVHSSALVTSLKATGAVVDTGTSDVTIVTPKAIADSAVTTASKTQTLTNKTINASQLVDATVTSRKVRIEKIATANQATNFSITATGTATDVTSLTVSITPDVVSNLYFALSCAVADSAAQTGCYVFVYVDGGAELRLALGFSTANYYVPFSIIGVKLGVTAAAHTVNVKIQQGSAGTMTLEGGAGNNLLSVWATAA